MSKTIKIKSFLFIVTALVVMVVVHSSEAKSLKNGEVYRSWDGKEAIEVVSENEVELSAGGDIFLAQYTFKNGKLRIVATVLGTKMVQYYELTHEGLKDTKGNVLYSKSAFAEAKQKEKNVLDEDINKSKKDALIAITNEDWNEALILTKKVQAYNPKESELSILLFNKLIDSAKKAKDEKRWDNVLEQGKLALIIKPNDSEMLQLVNDVPFLRARSQAQFAFEQERWDDALQHVKKALSIKPDDAEMDELFTEVLYQKRFFVARKALELNEYDKALDNIEEALMIKPENNEANTVRRMIWKGIREDPQYFGRFFKVIDSFSGHKDDVVSVAFYSNSNGNFLASGSEDGSVKLWNVHTGKEISSFTIRGKDVKRVNSISLSSNGNFLVSQSRKKSTSALRKGVEMIHVWNTRTGEKLLEVEIDYQRMLRGFALSPDGNYLSYVYWELERTRTEPKAIYSTIITQVDVHRKIQTEHTIQQTRINLHAYSPDGKYLALASKKGTITLWDKRMTKKLQTFSNSYSDLNFPDIISIMFDKDSQKLAVVVNMLGSKKIIILNTQTGNVLKTFSGAWNSIAFSPDWKTLAMGMNPLFSKREIELLDVDSGKTLRKLKVESSAKSLTFSPDGKLLVAGCKNGNIYIWGLDTKYISNLTKHDRTEKIKDSSLESERGLKNPEPKEGSILPDQAKVSNHKFNSSYSEIDISQENTTDVNKASKQMSSFKEKIESNQSQLLYSKTKPRVRMETNYGVFTLKLYPKEAPKTVENFLQYVRDGFYDGTNFHRVIKGFMIQGGGLNANLQEKPTRNPIINEADNGLKNLRGTVTMARSNDPHSASSQFFINTANNNSLNFKRKNAKGWGYCVFGKVVDGMDVVNTIENLPTITKGKFHDVPANPVIIESAIVENDTQQSNYTTSGNIEKSDNSNKVSSSVFAKNNSNVYHKSNCPELGTEGLMEFASSHKARKSGGVPCVNCNP